MTGPPTLSEKETRECVRAVFLSLGFDIDDRDDVRKLAGLLRWACEQRESRDRHSVNNRAALWSVISALLGGLAVSVGEWLRSLNIGGH